MHEHDDISIEEILKMLDEDVDEVERKPSPPEGKTSCFGDRRYFIVVDCEKCRDFAECSAVVEDRHPGTIKKRAHDRALIAKLPEFRQRVLDVIDRARDESRQTRRVMAEARAARAAEAQAATAQDASTTPRIVLTEAERKRQKRDEAYARKIAAVPAIDEDGIRGQVRRRLALLHAKMERRPLPPALRNLTNNVERYVMAWLARELARAPDPVRPAGRPKTTQRIAEIFDDEFGLPAGTTTPATMSRMLKVVEKLETEVWTPEALRGGV